jgi:iron complex outermembrane receptor protein
MKSIIALSLSLFTSLVFSQNNPVKKDTIKLEDVLVTATRANKKDPFTKSTITKKDLEKRNLGQDIPQLLNYLPNVVTTSDAGAGVGYTGIRVRGSDATRVNVTINGIPLNDSESQGTFWVDLPDFASSVQSIQLQRGVGTSTNGAGAFGASLSLATDGIKQHSFAEIGNSYGSFNTHKHHLKFGTGTLNEHFNVIGRVSTIQSDGYIDRASSDLKSLYLEANYFNENTSIKALIFGGSEITYQSWFGIDAATLETDRTYNPAGEIRNDLGEVIGFYDNQVDDYKQDHYQLHINHEFSANWTANLAFHYTYGRGFFESYKENQAFSKYGFTPITINGNLVESTDLVRQKWLKNDFYGSTFSAHYKSDNFKFIFGGAYNKYDGDHFGKVIWSEFGSTSNSDKYYDNTGVKKDFNVFAKMDYTLNKTWRFFADLQFRTVDYSVNGIDEGPVAFIVNDQLNFFNPKAGITYNLSDKSNFYLSYARANKEPKRSDYEDGNTPKPEQLDDFELGWNYKTKKTILKANLYYMNYHNQLVLTGALTDVGNPIAKNIGKSYRLGLEIDALFQLTDKLTLQPNLALSTNKNEDKFEKIDGVLQDLGNTDLSFSPEIIAGNSISFQIKKNISIAFLSKYVGEQFMSNIEHSMSKLDTYFVNDLSIQYIIKPKKLFKEIQLTALINNIFDKKYVSNGYFFSYDDTWSVPNQTTTIFGAGYYPQAGIHFLTGVTLKF